MDFRFSAFAERAADGNAGLKNAGHPAFSKGLGNFPTSSNSGIWARITLLANSLVRGCGAIGFARNYTSGRRPHEVVHQGKRALYPLSPAECHRPLLQYYP